MRASRLSALLVSLTLLFSAAAPSLVLQASSEVQDREQIARDSASEDVWLAPRTVESTPRHLNPLFAILAPRLSLPLLSVSASVVMRSRPSWSDAVTPSNGARAPPASA